MRKTFKELDKTVPTKDELIKLHPFLKSGQGRRILKSLFIETVPDKSNVLDIDKEEGTKPIFTLKDHNHVKDGVTYYSLRNIYFSYDHIPGYEYEFAVDVFLSWGHWQLLTEVNNIIGETIQRWREEYTVMIQSKALKALAKTAYYEGSKGTPAARFLADRGWEVKRGRPSKDEVTRERKIAAGVEKEVAEDIERMGLTLVKSN